MPIPPIRSIAFQLKIYLDEDVEISKARNNNFLVINNGEKFEL